MSQDTPSDVKAPYSNRRHKTTIRIRPDLWAEFLEDVAEKDLSTCHVLEALIGAWLRGGAMVPGLAQPLQLNLTMQHVVARPRRRGPEPEVSDSEWWAWVQEYEETYGYTPVKIGPRRYLLKPV